MTSLPERLVIPPPFSVKVSCDGQPHRVEVRGGHVFAVDHPIAEQAVALVRDENPACIKIIADLEATPDLLAERETESLREGLTRAQIDLAAHGTPAVRATTTTIPGQLTRLMLLRSIANDARFRPGPERFFITRTRFIADQVYAGPAEPWLEQNEADAPVEGRVLVSDDWLASVFVPGLEVVNGVPISAVRTEDDEIFLLSLIAEADGTIHSRELDWLDAELPAGLMLL